MLMLIPIVMLTLATTATLAADTIPKLDAEGRCRAIAGTAGPVADVDGCIRDENAARDQLARQWAQFPPGERSRCVQLATMAGAGTYTHLLTCLEVTREAGKLHGQNPERTGEQRR
jgi:hypothetical protein